ENLKHLIQKSLDKDENMLSSWKKNSIVSQFNHKKKNQLQLIDKNFFKILKTVYRINKKTYGKLDITIGKLINIWGFGTTKKPPSYPSITEIKKNIDFTGIKHIKIIRRKNK
ncbi:FAD:protein FMN transferase, partial [Buchnera aphidicola]|nr:FAD:protein FMN transferase [Buchnera aphidicola]